ncbi:hypothetical protein SLS56_008992 [Neofusicoccum ribis]|uniref:C2H2-type domain-containing protein n=1 Tax=Neofusicoccum ribis TaxID=45134 RepID=A0ABR3SJA8_9PEZI
MEVLKLFERKPSDPSDPSSSPVEVPIKWDLTREFVLYPNGKGGPVKLPSTQHVKRPSPEMVQKLRQGKPEFFLTGCKITPASEISHEWGYEGSILLYDPKDPAVSSVEYVYLTDHLPEQAETRRGVLTDPKSNLFFVTLKGDSLPTYHFWQNVRKDGNPGEAEVFDWATYMDACASRRASEQLDSDTIRISGELHHANDDFEDNEEDEIDEAINAKLRRVTRSTRLRDDLSDDDSIKLGRPSRKHRYAPTPKPPPGRDSYDDFFLDSNNNELEGEALHRGLKDLFGFGRYYECPTDRLEYADPEVERLAREFEENLRVEGLESTLRDFGFWQGNRSKKNQHFGGRSPPSEPPKRNWPKNKVLETVAYKLAVASKHTKGLPPLTGDEPWTRDDSIGFWTSLDPKIKPRVPSRLQKQDPTRYKRPAGVTKERNKNRNLFTGGFTNFRNRFQRAPREPSYIRPWEQTSWKPKLQVDSEIELHQHLMRLRRRPKKSNLRQTTTRSTLSSSRPTHYPSSGRSSEWRNVTSSGISSRLAPPGAWSFRTRSTRSYLDSSPNHSPMSDVRSTTLDPFFPRTSSSSSSFPTRTDSRETYAPSTLSFADSWWQQNSQMYGPLRQRGSFAHLATASSGTLPSSSRHASADARATGLVDEGLRFRDFDGDHTSGLHRGRRGPSKGRVSFDLPEDDGGRRVPFREVRLRDGSLREVRSALHKTRDGGEQALRDTCQICTENLTSAPDWLKGHHHRRHGRYLRTSSSSSTDYVPWFTVACHVCHKLLATPREYALCYKHHFKGKLGNALENHPEVQRELRRMNWRVTCPTCHRDLRDLTRLEWPQHFASHGPTLASIAEHKARDKADFWKQWFDTASGHGPVAGNVRNTVDQYICSICKNPLVEMTMAQKRQHYNAHVQEGAAVPGNFATTTEAAADVNATMYESESDVGDPNEDTLVDSINNHRTPQRVVDADKDSGDSFEDSISDSTDWDIVPTGFMEEHYSREGISKRQYRPHSAPPTHRFPRSSSTGPSSSQPTRSLFPNAPTTPENDFDSIFDNRRPAKPQRRPKPRSTPRRHRSSSAPPPSSKLAALQSDRGGEAHIDKGNDSDGYYNEGNYGNNGDAYYDNGDEEPLLGGKEDPFNDETGDPFDNSNGYKGHDAYHDHGFNSPLYGLHRRPSIRKLISDCFTGSTSDRLRNTARTRAPDRDAALRAEARTPLVLAHEDARLAAAGAGAAPSLYDAQRHRWHRRTHACLVAHVRANAARRASGRPPAPFPDFDVALLAERVRERPGAYGFDEGLAHHEARVARRRVVAERAYARAHPEWDGGMRAGMVFDEGVVPGRGFGDGDGGEGFLDDDDDEEEDVGWGVPPPGLERERRERGHVPDQVGPAVDVDSEEEPLPRYPEFDGTPPPPYQTLFESPRRNRSVRGGPAQDIARVPVSNRSIRRMPDVSRNREQSAATAARARERFYANKDNGELHRSLASKASRHHPYQRGVAGELHRRVASDPEDEEEEDAPRWLHRRGDGDEETSGDDVQTARSSVMPEGLKRDVASGRPVAEIESEWLEEINESVELSRFWLRLRAALVLDEQLRMESEDERLAKEVSVVPVEQSLAEGESGALGEVMDESKAQQSQLSSSSSSKRKIKKRRMARDKTCKPTVEDEADEADILEEDAFVVPQIIAEEIVSPRDKKPVNRKRKPAGEPDGPWQPSKQARVEEVLEEFEEPEEKKKGKRKAKAKGIEKTVTFEVKNQPIAELETTTPESKGKTAGRKRETSTSAALTEKPAAKTRTTKSPALKRLSLKTTGKRRKDRSRGPSPELERASEGATKYSLRKR